MNLILVPALLLLVGLAVYKKVLEPRRAAAATAASAGSSSGPRESKAEKKALKVRANAGSGRMGSVL